MSSALLNFTTFKNRKTGINILLRFPKCCIQEFLRPVYCIRASFGFLRRFQKIIALKRVKMACPHFSFNL
jgi:hypothetical protein